MGGELESLKAALADAYLIEHELGRGGMATVYLAQDLKLGRKVAIKVIHSTLTSTVQADRFLQEVEITVKLQHPHILPVHDSGRAGDLLYFVMPYVEGESLKERVDRETQLPLEDAIRIAREVAGALEYAHGLGIVHRDVKPANILLSQDHALLADFGVARALEEAESKGLTSTGFTVGTPAYMAPEQASGQGADARSDQWALAAVVYEMLTGEPPFTGPTPQAILARSVTEKIRPVDDVRNVPEHVALAIEQALSRVPADRFANVASFAAALRGDMSTITIERHKIERPERGNRRRAGLLAAVAAAVAVGVGGWLGGWFSGGGADGGPAISPNRVAIFPFGYTGRDELAHLSEGMATLLSSTMDGVGDIRTVDPAAVIGLVAQATGGVGSAEQTLAVVEPLGAGRYVRGTIQETGGRLTVTASLNDPLATPAELRREVAEGDSEAGVFAIVNELSVELLRALGVGGTPQNLESISTNSVSSLNDYLQGEADMRRGNYPGAVTELRRAVASDSLFALAWLRLSYAQMYVNPMDAVDPAQRANDLARRLSRRHQRLAEAQLASVHARADEAARLYGGILDDYPNDIDALFTLADTRLHFGPLYGWPMDSLGADFDRVLALDANHAEALYHRPWAAGLDGDFDSIGYWTGRVAGLGPNPVYGPVYENMRAVAERDTAAFADAAHALGDSIGALPPGGDDFLRYLAINMVSTLRDLEATEHHAERLFDDPARHPDVRAVGHLVRAHQLAGAGKWAAANQQFEAAAALSPVMALEARAQLALHPYAPAVPGALEAIRDELQMVNPDDVPRSTYASPFIGFLVPHDGWHNEIRQYLLGVLSARLGEPAKAEQLARQLARTRSAETAEGIIGSTLARNVRAHLAFEAGRSEDALATLRQPGLEGRSAGTVERTYGSPVFSGALERFRQARALAASGRELEALDMYEGIWMLNAYDLAYLAPAHLELARLYEGLGETEQAVHHYGRFSELWGDPDPELQLLVDEARRRIAELGRVTTDQD